MRRIGWATTLGLVIAVVLAQPAAARCSVESIDRLVKGSDDVWWGTVTQATAAPAGGPGTWELTVRLDQVLKGEGAPGDTYTVYKSSCGPYISPQGAEEAAPSFIGQRLLFLVQVDRHDQLVAYSNIVRVNGRPNASSKEQYTAALAIGLPRESPANRPPRHDPTYGAAPATKGADDSVTPILLLSAAMAVVAVAIAVVVLNGRRQS